MSVHHDGQPTFDEQEFHREIDHPVTIDDPYSTNEYRLYLLNRAYEGARPLVVYNGLGSTPNTLIGQLHLKSYAQEIPRPIIAPMNMQSSNAAQRRKFADGHAWALEKVSNEAVDITGMSWGGVLAYSVAESIQDKANHLTTTSSVGTRAHLAHYALGAIRLLATEARQINKSLGAAIQDTHAADIKHPHPPASIAPFDKLQRARLIGGRSFQSLATTLHPDTTWHDIIGEHDVLSNVREHVATIEQRNTLHPDSSSISVVQNHGHLWAHMRPTLARLVHESLQYDKQTPLIYYRARNDLSDIDRLDLPRDESA